MTLWPDARWAYRRVILISLCPSSSFTVVRSTPAMIICDAKVCRRSWKWKSCMPAFLHAVARTARGPSFPSTGNCRPSDLLVSRQFHRIASVAKDGHLHQIIFDKVYFFPRIASLAALATRNFTTFLAGIFIEAPV